MNVLSSHPFYIKREDINPSNFEAFINEIKEKGYYIYRNGSNFIRIANNKDTRYNNIIVHYPEIPNCELATCKFYNADGPFVLEHHHPITALSLVSAMTIAFRESFYTIMHGNDLKNYDRALNEPFCSKILKIFLNHIKIFQCPKCGGYTFSKKEWEQEDSRFTEERITHGLNAIATVLFLGGHGAGGEWSQATKQRYKYKGFNLTCSKCGSIYKITTSMLPV